MKIGFFITARLKSSRLKQKILLDLNSKTVLERVIERCKSTVGVDGIVLCTSTNPQDSILYDYAQRAGIQFYAGSEDDVLQRLLSAAKYYYYDAFVSITADNPLFSIYTSQLLIDRFRSVPFDFGFVRGLPIGMATSMIETKALDVAVYMKKQTDTEIWGPFVNRPDFFNIFNLVVENGLFDESKRLTLDYPEDYELLQNIFRSFRNSEVIQLHSLFQLLKENPSLFEINQKREQRWPTEKEIAIIRKNFNQQLQEGASFANQNDKKLNPSYSELIITI